MLKTPHEINSLFSRVSSVYDRMNDWMSMGLHRAWKQAFVHLIPLERLKQRQSVRLLDMACGTGDITEAIMRRAQQIGLKVNPTLADINEKMLSCSRLKHAQRFDWCWQCEDAMALSLASGTVDLYTVAFGLRNMPDMWGVFQEALRVLRPGGAFFCLEFSAPPAPSVAAFYALWNRTWMPLLARLLAQDVEAYAYLRDSIEAFPAAAVVQEIMQRAGFQRANYARLSGGIVAVHWGYKKS